MVFSFLFSLFLESCRKWVSKVCHRLPARMGAHLAQWGKGTQATQSGKGTMRAEIARDWL